MSDMLNFYTRLLSSLGLEVDTSTGEIFNNFSSKGRVQFTIDGKPLKLPTKELLRSVDHTKVAFFHPICESNARGESEIIHLLQKLCTVKISENFARVSEALLLLATDAKRQNKLTASQMKKMTMLTNIDTKTIKALTTLLNNIALEYKGGEDKRIAKLFLKRGGQLDGERFSRVCMVGFPLIEAINRAVDKKDRVVWGIKVDRVRDIDALVNLCEVMLPSSTDGSTYCVGTNAKTAPYFIALLRGYAGVIEQLNSIIQLFHRAFGGAVETTDIAWVEDLDKIDSWHFEVPPLPYNEGEVPDRDKSKATPVNSSTPMPEPAQQPAQQVTVTAAMPPLPPTTQAPTPPVTPATSSDNGKLSWGSVAPQMPPMQQMYQPQMYQNMMPQQMQPTMMPQYQVQAMSQAGQTMMQYPGITPQHMVQPQMYPGIQQQQYPQMSYQQTPYQQPVYQGQQPMMQTSARTFVYI